jgi:hypothetical protein
VSRGIWSPAGFRRLHIQLLARAARAGAVRGGLAVVLTVNDPVSVSDVPPAAQGQAAGVSATAEQFGGALGMAVLYLIFHTTYFAKLHSIINRGPLADLDVAEYERFAPTSSPPRAPD